MRTARKTSLQAVRRRLRRRQAGFTLLEVMIALAIMTFGAVGLMSLQQASTRGNMNARMMSTGVEINRRWLERVRADALAWTNNRTAVDRQDTLYLNDAIAPVAGSDWYAPPNSPRGFAGADWYGRDSNVDDCDVAGDAACRPIRYCTHLRVEWIVTNSVARVDARTFWYRAGSANGAQGSDRTLIPPACGANQEDVVTNLILNDPQHRIQSVASSVIVRWTQMGGRR